MVKILLAVLFPVAEQQLNQLLRLLLHRLVDIDQLLVEIIDHCLLGLQVKKYGSPSYKGFAVGGVLWNQGADEV